MGEGAVIVRAGVGHVLGALGLELGDIPAVDSYAVCMVIRAANDPSVFTVTEKARTRAFSYFKAPTSVFTFKALLRHYAKLVLT